MVAEFNEDYKYKKLYSIVQKFAEEDSSVYLAHMGLIFTLLRYPMPTKLELNRLKEGLESVETAEQFEILTCWLDEFDEIDLGSVDRNTPFVTADTKNMIFWLFSYTDEAFNKTALIHFLERYISRSPLERWYKDLISSAY